MYVYIYVYIYIFIFIYVHIQIWWMTIHDGNPSSLTNPRTCGLETRARTVSTIASSVLAGRKRQLREVEASEVGRFSRSYLMRLIS